MRTQTALTESASTPAASQRTSFCLAHLVELVEQEAQLVSARVAEGQVSGAEELRMFGFKI